MTTAIELANQRKVELSYLQTVGEVLAKSHFFDDAQSTERAVAKILAGQEFGMGALESMRAFHVIDGKVEMSADAQARLVKESAKYDYIVLEVTDQVCSIQFYDNDGEIGTSTFTIADAERAGIVKSEGAWKKYPRNMLFARALTNGVAWFCPDAISGGRVYAPGEIGETWEVKIPAELEPVEGSAGSSVTGMGEAGGSSAHAENTGADADDPARESLAYGEGAGGSTGEEEGPPSSSPETSDPSAPPAGTEDSAPATETERTSPPGSPTTESAGGSVERAKSSQTKQLLRHAAAMRWSEEDIGLELENAYPGVKWLTDLSVEQARELISVWGRYVKDSRFSREDQEALKPLCTVADAKAAAEVLFGFKVSSLGDLTKAEGQALIESVKKVRAEQAEVTA